MKMAKTNSVKSQFYVYFIIKLIILFIFLFDIHQKCNFIKELHAALTFIYNSNKKKTRYDQLIKWISIARETNSYNL